MRTAFCPAPLKSTNGRENEAILAPDLKPARRNHGQRSSSSGPLWMVMSPMVCEKPTLPSKLCTVVVPTVCDVPCLPSMLCTVVSSRLCDRPILPSKLWTGCRERHFGTLIPSSGPPSLRNPVKVITPSTLNVITDSTVRRVAEIEFPGDGGLCIEASSTVTGTVNCTRDEVGNLNSISLLSVSLVRLS